MLLISLAQPEGKDSYSKGRNSFHIRSLSQSEQVRSENFKESYLDWLL